MNEINLHHNRFLNRNEFSRRSSILQKLVAEVAERNVAKNVTSLAQGRFASYEYLV